MDDTIGSVSSNSSAYVFPHKRERSVLWLPGRVTRLFRDHPVATKVATIAVSSLTVLATIRSPELLIRAAGMALLGTSLASFKILEATFGFSWDMTKSRGYEEIASSSFALQVQGHHVKGRSDLTYRGDVPVYSVQAQDNFGCGYIQGLQLAPKICVCVEKMKGLYSFARRATRLPVWPGDDALFVPIRKVMQETHLTEIDGLVAGYNQWAVAQGKETLTANEILLFHLLPELHHFNPFRMQDAGDEPVAETVQELVGLGCTTAVSRASDGTVIFGRNLDWLSHNFAGELSLLVRRTVGSNPTLLEFTLPLCLGVVTGMTDKLSISMNISPGKTRSYRGMPAVFVNRLFLEKCSSVQDVLDLSNARIQALGPYHMTVADARTGGCLHWYQDVGTGLTSHLYEGLDPVVLGDRIRRVGRTTTDRIVVANRGFKVEGEKITPLNYHDSDQRRENVAGLIDHARSHGGVDLTTMMKAMKAPLVNNCETVQHALMVPAKKTMHVAFDNLYAGDREMQEVSGLL